MHWKKQLPALVFFGLLVGCGDKTEPGIVETTEANEPSTTGTTGASTTTGAATTTTGDTSSTTGSTTAGTTTGSTTGTTANGLCNTGDTSITYATHASVVLNATCTSCHAPGGVQSGLPLNTKATAISTFQNHGGQSQVDTRAMPQGSSLTANQICILDNWVTQGYN